jgi:hypothetical protein
MIKVFSRVMDHFPDVEPTLTGPVPTEEVFS